MPIHDEHKLRQPEIRKIGILGPSGTHSHALFEEQFDLSKYTPFFSNPPSGADRAQCFQDLLDSVSGDQGPKTDCCIIPFHNSSEQYFKEMPPLLVSRNVFVVDIKTVEVKHCLLVNPCVMSISEIEAVYSKDHIFKQCAVWLAEHHLAELREMGSSASAAEFVSKNKDKKYAAIGRAKLADKYSLKRFAMDIQKPNNFTSFFVISHKERSFNKNPYVLYAVPLNLMEDSYRVNEIITNHSFFWVPLWISPNKQGGFWYIFQLGTDGVFENVVAFEKVLKQNYSSSKRLGFVDKNISTCVVVNRKAQSG